MPSDYETLKVWVTQLGDGTLHVRQRCGNSETFEAAIGLLKGMVATRSRRYLPESKIWEVDASASLELSHWLELCRSRFPVEVMR